MRLCGLVLSSILLVACQSAEKTSDRNSLNVSTPINVGIQGSNRKPASHVSGTELETRYLKLISGNTEQIKKQMARNLEMLISGFFRAEALKNQFDQELDSIYKVQKMKTSSVVEGMTAFKSYPSLLALWHIRETIEEKILYYHRRLLFSSMGYDGPQKVAVSQETLRYFHKSIALHSEVDKLASNYMVREMQKQISFVVSNLDSSVEKLQRVTTMSNPSGPFRITSFSMILRPPLKLSIHSFGDVKEPLCFGSNSGDAYSLSARTPRLVPPAIISANSEHLRLNLRTSHLPADRRT